MKRILASVAALGLIATPVVAATKLTRVTGAFISCEREHSRTAGQKDRFRP